ncbi:MAG: adenylyl-sulfate kinase [Pirellulaceae bacterium]|nr:adenylyl-sulfate kinase [Planctomycetales bacterium]MCA9265360.1 adenylyl-sulfate kinase [Planctomycetales bacterium]
MSDQAPDHAHVTWHPHSVTRAEREQFHGHGGCVVWFTGLSGCGKSTVANAVDRLLFERGVRSFLLDGDNIRHGLNAAPPLLVERHGEEFAKRFGLGFSAQDREENIRRIAAVAQLFCSAGIVTLTAFVSPYRVDRDAARALVQQAGDADDFLEVFVDTPLDVCERRDPKGLYKKARAGEIKNFTGIDDPYEPPLRPELVVQGAALPPEQLAQQVVNELLRRGKLKGTSQG